jgi:hypothetical protein
MDMRFGTGNLRSLYRSGSLKTVASRIAKYKLYLQEDQLIDTLRFSSGFAVWQWTLL